MIIRKFHLPKPNSPTPPSNVLPECVGGNGGNHQPKGPSGFPEPVNYTYQWTSLVIQTSHIVPLALTKAGIIFFYRRIFKLKQAFNIITIALLAVVAIWTIVYFFVLLFICTPIPTFLHEGSFSPDITCGDRAAIWNSFSITDFLTDLAILIVPIPFVWSVQMAFKLKLAVTGVFLLGALYAPPWPPPPTKPPTNSPQAPPQLA